MREKKAQVTYQQNGPVTVIDPYPRPSVAMRGVDVLAARLGVPPVRFAIGDPPRIFINGATGQEYDLTLLIHRVLDRLDAATAEDTP